MPITRDFYILANEEAGLRSHWYDVFKHIKKDLAYIWCEEVKKDIQGLKSDLKKIKHTLRKLSSYYKETDIKTYHREISDIDTLLNCLTHVQPSEGWVEGAYTGLKRVIADVEEEKIGLRQLQGNLHVHSKDVVGGIPVAGSNCGELAVAEIIRYAGARMGQKFIAITDHSRDADLQGALGYWEKEKGMPEVARYGDKRIKDTYRRIDAIRNPPLKVFKGIEVNLLPNGQFDSNLPASAQVQCVNCSIHPKVDIEGFAQIIKEPELYTNLVLKGIQNQYTNIMCHIGYGCEQRVVEGLDWKSICKAAIANEVAVEINLKSLIDLIFKKLLNFGEFPANKTDYRDEFRKKLKHETAKYIPLVGSPKIRGIMTPYFGKGLKIAINTDLHWNPFIGLEDAKKDGAFREFRDLSPDNVNFRIMRIRFFVCLKTAEKEFQKLFSEAGIKLGNIINSYSPRELAAFLRKPRVGRGVIAA